MSPLFNSVSAASWLACVFFFFWSLRRLQVADGLPDAALARVR